MVDELKSKGMTIKDEPGQSVVRVFGPGVGTEKVRPNLTYMYDESMRLQSVHADGSITRLPRFATTDLHRILPDNDLI